MNKKELITALSQKLELTQTKAKQVVEYCLTTIQDALAKNKLKLRGFKTVCADQPKEKLRVLAKNTAKRVKRALPKKSRKNTKEIV